MTNENLKRIVDTIQKENIELGLDLDLNLRD